MYANISRLGPRMRFGRGYSRFTKVRARFG